MKYKTGKNNLDLCCSMDLNELMNPLAYKCENLSKSRTYTMTETKKKTIINGLKTKGIDIYKIEWIGEKRTKLKNSSSLLSFGYSTFVDEN